MRSVSFIRALGVSAALAAVLTLTLIAMAPHTHAADQGGVWAAADVP